MLDRDLGNRTDAAPAVRLSDAHATPKRIRDRRRRPARLDKRSGAWKRICELRAVYASALGDRPLTPLLESRITEAAHLAATAEIARARFLKGEAGIRIDAVATCERIARDAVRALGLVDGPKPRPASPLAEHFSRPPGSSA